MKKCLVILVVVVLLFSTCSNLSYAGEIDVLLDLLVEKKVLTSEEAQNVKAETERKVAKQMVEEKPEVPSWVQKLKLTGDVRVRYQYEKKDGSAARNRGRLRYRLGMLANINKQWTLGAGLASGSNDPRSTNQSFTDAFATPDIRMDYAYAKYLPFVWMEIVAGKFQFTDYLWQQGDLLWDSDINPEGGSVTFKKSVKLGNVGTDLFFNTGTWILDEASGDVSDPFMVYLQPGSIFQFSDVIALKTAVAYYNFVNVKGAVIDHSSGTNTTESNGALAHDYDVINPVVELGFKSPFGKDHFLQYFAFFGGFASNLDEGADNTSDNDGWQAGVKLGYSKLKSPGDWQVKYQYSMLGKDAFPDSFPDSDRYNGATDIKGHEIALEYMLMENVIAGIDYYRDKRDRATESEQDLIQGDLSLKF